MKIETEDDLKAITLRKLREKLGLTQPAFWSAVGVTVLRGARYENGFTKVIPRDVRRLVFLHYIIGIPTNASPEDLLKFKQLGDKNVSRRAVQQQLNRAEQALTKAKELLNAIEPEPHSA